MASFVSKLKRYPVLPLAFVAIAVVTALFADFIAPHSPYTISLGDKLAPPSWAEDGSPTYLLGADHLGRDILSRMIYGTRVSLLVAALTLVVGASLGGIVGICAGYFGGKVDAILMRITDAAISFPIIFFALILVATLGPSLLNVVLAVGLLVWARYARVVRGEVLSLRQRDFVALARIANCSSLRIMLRHILPNVANTLMVLASLQVGWVIIVEASLSFLGAGVPPPSPTWGGMVSAGRGYIADAWWASVFPGLAIAVTVVSFNMFGDWLRDTLDPKLRQV